MTQIIHLILFLKDLLFNDRTDKGPVKPRNKFFQILVVVAILGSVGLNIQLINWTWSLTAKIVIMKAQLQEAQVAKEKMDKLQRDNEVLSRALNLVAPDRFPWPKSAEDAGPAVLAPTTPQGPPKPRIPSASRAALGSTPKKHP